MRRLLCVSGKRFSGKDSFAALLCASAARRGLELLTYAFADVSKRLFVEAERRRGVEVDLQRLLGDRAYKEAWRPKLTEFTVASLAEEPRVFVQDVAERIDADARPALVTDLRLRLELDFLAARYELVVIRLLRSDEARAASGWAYDADKDLHPTETELDEPSLWTEVVRNDGSADDLAREAERLTQVWLR